MGDFVGRSDKCESGKVLQADIHGGVGTSSMHREELQNGGSCTNLVVASHCQHKAREGEKVSLGGKSLEFAPTDDVCCDPAGNGNSVRMEFEGGSESPTSN